MTKYIHIHAKCDAFEIFEQVCESKAVRRLINIRTNFRKMQEHYGGDVAGNLVVNTRLVNPELQLR